MDHQPVIRYLKMALDQSDPDLAKELFFVAWRCRRLEEKNRRLLRLIEDANEQFATPEAKPVVLVSDAAEYYADGFATYQVQYLRAVAKSAPGESGALHLADGADDLSQLENRNRAIREALNGYRYTGNRTDLLSEWNKAVQHEIANQNECSCAGVDDGFHMCPNCQEYSSRICDLSARLARQQS